MEKNVNNLYVGNFCWFPGEYDFWYFKADNFKITNQKYIFEKISENKYLEVFTGMLTAELPEFSEEGRILYIDGVEPIINYIPEMIIKEYVDKKELLIAMDIINFSKEYESSKSCSQKLLK